MNADQVLTDKKLSRDEKILALNDLGKKPKEIAELMGMHPLPVRGVLHKNNRSTTDEKTAKPAKEKKVKTDVESKPVENTAIKAVPKPTKNEKSNRKEMPLVKVVEPFVPEEDTRNWFKVTFKGKETPEYLRGNSISDVKEQFKNTDFKILKIEDGNEEAKAIISSSVQR